MRRDIDPGRGLWVLPGGFVDRYEEVPAAARREVLEETGLTIELTGLIGIYSYSDAATAVAVYAARPVSGELMAGDESAEAAWFAADEIPWDELAFQSSRDALGDYLKR